jgi:hypothetical protein
MQQRHCPCELPESKAVGGMANPTFARSSHPLRGGCEAFHTPISSGSITTVVKDQGVAEIHDLPDHGDNTK